ncbi:MAG: hypothetical protein WC070_01930 [Candidatus Magasanikbacteria bacterium]
MELLEKHHHLENLKMIISILEKNFISSKKIMDELESLAKSEEECLSVKPELLESASDFCKEFIKRMSFFETSFLMFTVDDNVLRSEVLSILSSLKDESNFLSEKINEFKQIDSDDSEDYKNGLFDIVYSYGALAGLFSELSKYIESTFTKSKTFSLN